MTEHEEMTSSETVAPPMATAPPPPPVQYTSPLALSLSDVQPVWQFVLLNLCTLGLYQVVWFYRNWQLIKERNQRAITPFWRMLFAPLFIYRYYTELAQMTRTETIPERSPLPIYASTFFVCTVASRIFDRISMTTDGPTPVLFFLSLACLAGGTWALVPAVNTLNAFWRIEQPGHPERTTLSGWVLAIIIIGSIILLLAVLGNCLPRT